MAAPGLEYLVTPMVWFLSLAFSLWDEHPLNGA
jgi:hypothetical protein